MTETPAPALIVPSPEAVTLPTTTAPEPLLGGTVPASSEAPPPFTPLSDEDIAAMFGEYAPKGDGLKNVQSAFAELALDKPKAEKLSALYGSMQKEAEQATAAAWNETIKGWQDAARAHPDFGGSKFDTSLAQAKQIVSDYGDTSFQEMLAVTGVGNHPAMIAFVLKVAAALPGEARPTTVSPTAGPRDLASILFPNHGAN